MGTIVVTLDGVTLKNGAVLGGSFADTGAAINSIDDQVIVANSIFTSNRSSYFGGAIAIARGPGAHCHRLSIH